MAGQYDLPYTGPQVESLLAKVTELESEMPTKTSDLTNDSGFITAADVPTKTSDLTNDSGFITNAPVAAEAARAQAAEALLATIASLQAEITRATGVEGTLQGLIDGITAKIPSTATAQNQLADKDFVNSSISTNTAEFKGTYNSLSELQAVTANENDYGFVVSTDAAGNTVYSRYKYSGGSWRFEYNLNNSSFTAAQWAAINSAVTAELVAKLSALPDNATLTAALAAKQDVIDDLSSIRSKANSAYQKPSGGIPKTDLASGVQTSLDKADSAIQDVSDKADKDTDAVEGNVAQFDANGNPVDGGVPVENIAQKDGYYGGMTVGAAENLVGRGVVEAEYVDRRTSAGSADIGSGSASIRKIMGRSVKFNQLINYDREGTLGGVDYTADGNHLYGSGTTSASSGGTAPVVLPAVPADHKVYIKVNGSDSGYGHVYCRFYGSELIELTNFGTKIRTVSNTATTGRNVIITYSSDVNVSLDYRFQVIDLTAIFGAGNEPATVEDFEEWLAQNVGTRDYYPYTEPTILNNAADGIKTRGLNLFNPATGKAVLPGKYSDYPHEYEICGTFTSISYTDINGNTYVPELTDGKFFNVDAPGELTVVGGNSTDTLVHLVWSGWRNEGEPDYAYEAYWENTLALNLTTLTGKLNGEGESVVIAPNGLAKVGSVMDYGIVENGMLTKIVKCLGVVDWGDLGWAYRDGYHEFYVDGLGYKVYGSSVGKVTPTLVSQKYIQANKGINNLVSGEYVTRNDGGFFVRDDAYSSVSDFKAAVTGIMFYYELATPRVYVLDEPLAMNYRVDDFGTEETVPAYDPQRLIAPLAYDVQYAMNAVDVIRRLPDNYVERADVKQTPGTSEKHILSQKGVEDNYAHKVGTEDNLTVGLAKNIEGNATSGGYPFTFAKISGTDGLAKINNVKGDSLVWNQLIRTNQFSSNSWANLTLTNNGDGSYTANGTTDSLVTVNSTIPVVSGHKYLMRGANSTNTFRLNAYSTTYWGQVDQNAPIIITALATGDATIRLVISANASLSNEKIWPNFIDLTLMYGAGNEPSTVAEFEALYPLPYYAHNAGTILGNKTEQVKAVGFNQYDPATGKAKVIGGQQYYIGGTYTALAMDGETITPDNHLFTPVRTGEVVVTGGNATDTIINLSDPSRNGTYEPYKTNTIELNLPTLTGKLNGEGESVTVFPEGLKSAGSVYDEIVGDKAIKRVGIVDLGTLTWTASASYQGVFSNGSIRSVIASNNCVCSLYSCNLVTSRPANMLDKQLALNKEPNSTSGYFVIGDIIVKDTSFTDAATFKAAMNGVMLYYALATPEEYTLDTPIPEAFQSYKGGTLEQIPQNTATPVTAPCAFSVTYAIDAAGIITGLPKNYVSKESMQAFLTALGTAMSGTWTMTWDDTTGRYTFTFTPNE